VPAVKPDGPAPFAIAFTVQTPHGVCTGVHLPESADDARPRLHPDEWALCQTLAPALRPGFAGGRVALRHALAVLPATGVSALLKNHRGAPLLPPGLHGSISHKRTLAVALAAHGGDDAIGIDVEDLSHTGPDIGRRILRDSEHAALVSLPADEQRQQTLLTFAVKEALYKALDPFVERHVSFLEAAIELPVALKRTFPDASFDRQERCPLAITEEVAVALFLMKPSPKLAAFAACFTYERFVIATARARASTA
jgi:4'-phosphopantetheinyl transferase EntD